VTYNSFKRESLRSGRHPDHYMYPTPLQPTGHRINRASASARSNRTRVTIQSCLSYALSSGFATPMADQAQNTQGYIDWLTASGAYSASHKQMGPWESCLGAESRWHHARSPAGRRRRASNSAAPQARARTVPVRRRVKIRLSRLVFFRQIAF
jgi:hypothetical protein